MIHVDEEFKALIPPLSREEYKQLEENCVKEGIRDPLVVWKLPGNEILIDGHNRWEISARHAGIPFNIVYKEFENREAVKEWIIKNQLGRRNISKFVRAELALKLKPVIAEKAKEQKLSTLKQNTVNQKSDERKEINTAKELAKVANVSHDTIHKVEVIKEKAHELDPRTIEDLRRGDVSINKVYSDIKASEHENIRQQETRELREAKKRAETFENSKVVAIGDAKQNKDDNEKLFAAFNHDFENMIDEVRRFSGMATDGRLEKEVKRANKYELHRMADHASELYRAALKIQRVIAEVIDEE